MDLNLYQPHADDSLDVWEALSDSFQVLDRHYARVGRTAVADGSAIPLRANPQDGVLIWFVPDDGPDGGFTVFGDRDAIEDADRRVWSTNRGLNVSPASATLTLEYRLEACGEACTVIPEAPF